MPLPQDLLVASDALPGRPKTLRVYVLPMKRLPALSGKGH